MEEILLTEKGGVATERGTFVNFWNHSPQKTHKFQSPFSCLLPFSKQAPAGVDFHRFVNVSSLWNFSIYWRFLVVKSLCDVTKCWAILLFLVSRHAQLVSSSASGDFPSIVELEQNFAISLFISSLFETPPTQTMEKPLERQINEMWVLTTCVLEEKHAVSGCYCSTLWTFSHMIARMQLPTITCHKVYPSKDVQVKK